MRFRRTYRVENDYSAFWARGDYADPREWNDGDAPEAAPDFAQFCQDRYGQALDRMDGFTFAEAKQAYYEETQR